MMQESLSATRSASSYSTSSAHVLQVRKPKRYLALLATLLWCHSTVVLSFVPPHPDSDLADTWEPVHDRRRRLQRQQQPASSKSDYNYSPQFVHPELCRYLSEDECQDVDESLQDHAIRHRSLLTTQERKKEPIIIDEKKNRPSGTNGDFDDHIDNNGFGPSSSSSSSSSWNNQIKHPALSTQQQPQAETRRNPYTTSNPDEPVLEALVILLRFKDHKDRDLPDKSVYETLWNERIKRWFDLNSYGNYQFHAHVTDWMDTNDTEASYAAGVSGLSYSLQEAFWPVLDQLNEDPTWDWSRFDRNGDGRLDSVVVLHSGYPAEVGGEDCTNDRESLDRIWSHAFASSQTWTTQGILGSVDFNLNLQDLVEQEREEAQQQQPEDQENGEEEGQATEQKLERKPLFYALHGYVIASALDGVCDSIPAKMGVMTHEYMHTLGLDDLYDYGSDYQGKGVGIWDILAYPYGAANDEDYPGHLSAYSKVSLGWLTPTEIEWNGDLPMDSTVMALRPAEISSDAIKIVLTNGKKVFGDNSTIVNQPPPPQEEQTAETKLLPQYQSHNGKFEEYLLLEHRQALEFDRDLNNKTGLVIYHVDESVPRMNSRGYPGQEGWPHNGNHYRVAVLAADTQFHLERGINKGDPQDTWKPGVVLGPGSRGRRGEIDGEEKESIDDNKDEGGDENHESITQRDPADIIYPNSDTYMYGAVRQTGISIETVSESVTELMVRISWREPDDTTNPVVEAQQEAPAQPESTDTPSSCDNLWSWVDLEVEGENGELTVESVACSDVASDTDRYCSLSDFSMGWAVWEICREECPNSDCNL